MSPPSDHRSSSLDPEILKELEAAEAGLPSALLNDTPLVDMDELGDDTPLVALNQDGSVVPSEQRRSARRPAASAGIRERSATPRAAAADRSRTELGESPALDGDLDRPIRPVAGEPREPRAERATTEADTSGAAGRHYNRDEPSGERQRTRPEPEPEDGTTSWFDDEPPLTQSMLDDLVVAEEHRREAQDAQAPPTPIAPVSEAPGPTPREDLPPVEGWTEDLLTQEDLDMMVHEPSAANTPVVGTQTAGLPVSKSSGQAPKEISPDDDTLSPDELDALIAGASESGAGDTGTADSTDSDEPMSQEDLDALIAGTADGDSPEETPVEAEDDSPLSQEDLDALIAGSADGDSPEETPAEAEDDGALSQEDLDALIAGSADGDTPEETPAEAEDDGPLSQDDLDALIAANADGDTPEETPPEAEDDGPLSQDDLDALIAANADGDTPEEAPPEAEDDGPLSQEDLDALIAGSADGDSPEEAPAQADAGSQDSLSQEDLDALLAAASDESPPANKENEGVQSLSDDDLEGLFDENDGAGPGDSPSIDEDSPLDQSSIDALLAGAGDDQAIGDAELDTPVVPEAPTDADDVSLTRSSIDSLMADLDNADATAAPDDSGSGEDLDEVSQDMIDALIASAQAEAPGGDAASESEVGSENLAAAATASEPGPDLLSQSDLDKLIEESRQQDKERGKAKQRALEEAIDNAQASAREDRLPETAPAAGRSKRFRKPGVVWPFVRDNFPRVAASVLVGLVATITTGALLHANREIVHYGPDANAVMELQVAMERAQDEINRGDYVAAIHELEDPVRHSGPNRLLNDARYLLMEARYRAFRGEWGTDAFDQMTARIDELVELAPNHTRAPEALYWKAKLFESDLPHASLEIYDQIFERYADGPGMDRMLIDAAHLSLAQNDPLNTAIRARDLLQRFPGSPWAGEAKLAIGDANVLAGNIADARAAFVRIAESEPDSRLGAEAYLRLGKLAFDEGQFDQAIMQLSRRLETTTTTEGNDEVYLLLAQAHRRAGQLNEARDTLTDLLNVFEPSDVTPRAFIEYSQVFEALGDRENAVKTAQRAALEYPNDPAVLRNHGEFQGLDGNPLTAAIALVQAEKAGATDPNLLLTAARYYRTANMPREAANTYRRLKNIYGGSPASLAGGIEAAQLRYEQGQAEGALEDLEALQAATRGTDHYLPAVQATLNIYKDLGLNNRVAALAGEVAQLAEEPEVVAQAAIDLMDAGDLERAQAAIGRTDLSRLNSRTAFGVLMKEGESLLAVAPQRGLDKMEEAYFNYPDARTPASDQKLLDTYLDTGRAAAARRMVMDLKATTEQEPVNAPYLVDAAVSWGNYLYDKEDYRTAVFAYNLAEEAGTQAGEPVQGLRSDPAWAKYQRANALLRLADYEGCLALFEEIAASESPWAAEASVKADLARLEQRQRGIPVASAQAG